MATHRNNRSTQLRWLLLPLLVGAAMLLALVDSPKADAGGDVELGTVCVTKVLGDNVSPSLDVTAFSMTLDGGPTPETKPFDTDVVCDGYNGSEGPAVGAVRFTAVSTAGLYTLSEVSPAGVPVGVSYGFCQSTNTSIGETFTVGSGQTVSCVVVNDSQLVCVSKGLPQGPAVDITAISFAIAEGGNAPGAPVVASPTIPEGCELFEEDEGDGFASFYITPGAPYTITETSADGRFGLNSFSQCGQEVEGFEETTTTTTSNTVSSQAEAERDAYCFLYNESIEVCVTKVLGPAAAQFTMPGAFTFEIVVGETVVDSGSPSIGGCVEGTPSVRLFAPPDTAFTVREADLAPGIVVTDSGCPAPSAAPAGSDKSSVAVGPQSPQQPGQSFVEPVMCTFTNDAQLVVCGRQALTPGDSGFTLADFTLELYQGGALVAPGRNAADPADNPCAQNVESAAPEGQVIGNSLLLGYVPFDAKTYTFVSAGPADPQNRLVLDAISCSPDAAAQPASAAQATFTAEPGTRFMRCTASHSTRALPGAGAFVRPQTEPAPAAVPTVTAPVVAQQVIPATATPTLAVTGPSRPLIPFALTIAGLGFASLGSASIRRRHHRHHS